MHRQDLEQAAEAGLLERDQLAPLQNFLDELNRNRPRFDFTHVLYYSGGLVAIGAMTLFMDLGWDQFGGWGIFFICLLYAGLGLLLTNRFLAKGYLIPAGLCGAFVIALVPLAVFGVMNATGVWPAGSYNYPGFFLRISFMYIYMELAAVLVAALMLYRYRLPFLTMPLAIALWYMSMDIAELFYGANFNNSQMGYVSMGFGAVMLILALYVDLRSTRSKYDYAFWLYILAVAAFWGGLSVQWSDSELAKLSYFAINLVLIGSGVLLARRVFVVFGAIGCGVYLSHLASVVFAGSWVFPIALSVLGLLIIYVGVWWQKHEARFTTALRYFLPERMRSLLESRFF